MSHVTELEQSGSAGLQLLATLFKDQLSSTEFISLDVLYVYSLITLWKDPQGLLCVTRAGFLSSSVTLPQHGRVPQVSCGAAQGPLLSLFNLPVHQIPTGVNPLHGNPGTGETQSRDQK